MRYVILAGAMIAFGMYVVCLVVGVSYGIRASGHLLPNAPSRRVGRFNRPWFKDQLTPTGLHYREKALCWGKAAIAAVVAFFLLGLLSSEWGQF
jgi:hypothetical protein